MQLHSKHASTTQKHIQKMRYKKERKEFKRKGILIDKEHNSIPPFLVFFSTFTYNLHNQSRHILRLLLYYLHPRLHHKLGPYSKTHLCTLKSTSMLASESFQDSPCTCLQDLLHMLCRV